MKDANNRFAAVDIGTNSARLLIARLHNRQLKPELRTLRMCRLGEGMTRGDGLQPQAVARTLQALQEFSGLLRLHGIRQVRAVATSAVREASNAALFVEQVRSQTGLPVDVISGEEEAYLSFLGACQSLPGVKQGTVVDIGGGSTEITFPSAPASGHPGHPGALTSRSIPLGAVRLTERPLLLSEILAKLKPALEDLQAMGPVPLIGVGGTITTLAAVDQALPVYDPERVHGYRLPRAAVERILFFLATKTNQERKQISGLQPERADIIVAGTTILWAILGSLEAEQITVSEADLLDGIILTGLPR
ncbi:MAG: Ppx/GppA phosphatase family protein [Thermacetogeniaceae bacterium]|jgi:exopolyphosphatase/guanosine-5'-triphosphate,3'-diphosphate pyrophosphatase